MMVIPRDTDATAGDVVARRSDATPIRRFGSVTRIACDPLRTVPVHSVEAVREPRKRRVTFAVPVAVDTYDTRMMSPACARAAAPIPRDRTGVAVAAVAAGAAAQIVTGAGVTPSWVRLGK